MNRVDLTAAQILDWLCAVPDEPQTLDPEYDGGCPCFSIETADGVCISGHCWRVCRDCPGEGVHVWNTTDRELADALGEVLKARLDAQEWYGEYTVQIGVPR